MAEIGWAARFTKTSHAEVKEKSALGIAGAKSSRLGTESKLV